MKHLAVLLSVVSVVGCGKDDDNDETTSPSSSSSPTGAWLVGDEGEMFRLAGDGSVTPYPLELAEDLNAIACVGTSAAWVAGDAGTLLSTSDGGRTWSRHALEVRDDLTAIATSEVGDGGPRVVVAGEGVLLSSVGDGTFVHVGDDGIGWTAVALDASGERLLAVTDDGALWRSDTHEPLRMVSRFEDQPLAAVAVSPDGGTAIAAGAAGFVVLSSDGGLTWAPVLVPTVRDLWAARIAQDGRAAIAVGEAGVVVRIDDGGVTADELLDPALSLRAVHMHAGGGGHAVGDSGTLLATLDAFATHTPIDAGTDAVLRGVDDVHVGPHW